MDMNDHSDTNALVELLDEQINRGRWRHVIPLAEHLATLLPSNPNPHRAMGIAWFMLHEIGRSERCFNEAMLLGDASALPRIYRARIAQQRGEHEEQRQWAQQAWELNPDSSGAPHLLFDAHLALGNVEDAESIMRRLMLQKGDDPGPHRTLAHMYLDHQRLSEAEEEFRIALQHDQTNAGLWADLGHVLSRQEKYPAALDAFCKAREIDPNTAVRHYNVGDTYLALKQYDKAVEPLRMAVQLDDSMRLAHYSRSSALLGLNRYEEAAKAAQAALRNDPEMRTVQTNLGLGALTQLGLARMNQARFEEAEACFRRLLCLIAPTYFNLGLTLFKSGRHAESLTMFQRALEIRPNEPEYMDLLGNALMELGRLEEAEDAFRRAIAGDAADGRNHYDLGVVLGRMEGRESEAIEPLRRSMELLNNDPHPYYAIASVYARMGERETALEHLRIARQMGYDDLNWIAGDADWDSLRSDARFIELTIRTETKEDAG